MTLKLIDIEQENEAPAITATIEVGESSFLSITIEKQKKSYRFILSSGKQVAEFKHNDWREFPPYKFRKKTKALGYDLTTYDVEVICTLIINDERSNWLEEPQLQPQSQQHQEEDYTQAKELLKDPYLLQKVRTCLDFKVAGMGRKKLGVFLALLTKNLKNPKNRISVCVWGKWGEGKSYLLEKVLELFEFERMNSATLPGIYRDSLKDPYYYDSRILYFGDLGDNLSDEFIEIFEFFKQLITEGKAVKKLVMKVEDELETESLELVGYPVLAWTAQNTPEDDQILSRILPFEPDMSENQRKLIQEHANVEHELPQEYIYPKEYHELKRNVKAAIKLLERNALPVLNPYSRLINECMSIKSPNVNRDRNKFFGIIAALTHLHQYQREKITIGNQEYVIVHPLDILNAIYLLGEEFKTLFGALDSLSQTAHQVIKDKVDSIDGTVKELQADLSDAETKKVADGELKTKGFTNNDLAEWLNIHNKTASKLTKNLYRKGILDRLKEGKSWKYYLLPEYDTNAQTNGNVLFDSRRMLENIFGDEKLREWLDTRNFQMPPESIERNIIFQDDLGDTPTPEYQINNFVYAPWKFLEIQLMQPAQTFNYFIRDGNVLRERRRTLEEKSLESGGKPVKNCVGGSDCGENKSGEGNKYTGQQGSFSPIDGKKIKSIWIEISNSQDNPDRYPKLFYDKLKQEFSDFERVKKYVRKMIENQELPDFIRREWDEAGI